MFNKWGEKMRDPIEREDVLNAIYEWICSREYEYTNASCWLKKRIEAIPSAKDIVVKSQPDKTTCALTKQEIADLWLLEAEADE